MTVKHKDLAKQFFFALVDFGHIDLICLMI